MLAQLRVLSSVTSLAKGLRTAEPMPPAKQPQHGRLLIVPFEWEVPSAFGDAMNNISRKWFDAGIRLSEDPAAAVRCP